MILFGCEEDHIQEEVVQSQRNPELVTPLTRMVDTMAVEPYPWDTLLSGGYHLSYRLKFDEVIGHNLQYLLLMKEDELISDASGGFSYGLPFKNLGFIAGDFRDYFILAHSFSFGSPAYFDLIKKQNGDEIESGFLIESSEKENWVFYANDDVMDKEDQLYLISINSLEVEQFDVPEFLFEDPEALTDIDTVIVKNAYIELSTYNDTVRLSR